MKHVKSYPNFLFEQEIPMDPAAAAPVEKEQVHLFVFLEPDEYSKIKKKQYPDGSSIADYPTFSATDKELTDWANKNIAKSEKHKMTDPELEIKRKNLLDIVRGKKSNIADSDLPFLEKLKNATATNIFGNKKADTTVLFTKKGEPTTHSLEVTFITLRK